MEKSKRQTTHPRRHDRRLRALKHVERRIDAYTNMTQQELEEFKWHGVDDHWREVFLARAEREKVNLQRKLTPMFTFDNGQILPGALN